MSETQALQVVPAEPDDLIQFGSFRHPETVLREMELVASSFKKRAEKMGLFKQIGQSKHLLVEGWQMLATMNRVTSGLVDDRYVEFGDAHGFEATAEAIWVPRAMRISTARAMCLNDEENWGMRSKYEWQEGKKVKVGETPTPLQQLRSMAQTRACSKVLSNLLKPVAKMAGFASTPAEEMTGDENHGQQQRSDPKQPQRKSEGNGGGGGGNGSALVSEAQVKRMFALARSVGKSDSMVRLIVADAGFPGPEDVTRARYEEICERISAKDGGQ